MKYYLATDEKEVFHAGELRDEETIVSGLPKLFIFKLEKELDAKLLNYGKEKDEFFEINSIIKLK